MEGKTLLVTGSRSIKNRALVFRELDKIVAGTLPDRLIHGGAQGVDILSGEWARARGIDTTKVVRPDFKTWPIHRHRWKAYTMRDVAMVDEADLVVALWDGHSSGTKLTYEYAASKDKLYARVVVKH